MRLASYIDSQQSKKVAKLVVKWRRPLGCILFLVGIVYLISLPRRDLSHKAFFDENALLAGVVRREFADPNTVAQYASEVERLSSNEFALAEWLEGEMVALGLETYTQNFTYSPPVTMNSDGVLSGGNIYGVVRSGRSSSAEAIILATPLQPDNTHGIPVLLALARFFKTKNFWAKDIIFLVTTHREVGMQAWINSYMGTYSTGIAAAPLSGRSGAIQAVVNLELPSATLQYANIIAEGINGILPNMDLVSVIVHLCRMEGIDTGYHIKTEGIHGYADQYTHYLSSLKSMVAIATHQAPGLPLANHGLFLKHRIDAVTLRGVASSTPSKVNSLLKVARALEGTFRSINNLLERLHHSEFFYYTTSTSTFVSIGLYMPPFGMLLAPVILEALAQWLLARDPGLADPSKNIADDVMNAVPPFPFPAVVRVLLSSLVGGVLLYATPIFLTPLTPDTFTATLLTLVLTTLTLPPLLRSGGAGDSDWRMAKVFALIFLILALIATAMMNFSLCVVVVMTFVPSVIWVEPLGERWSVWCVRVCVVTLLCPLCVMLCLCVLYQYYTLPLATMSEVFAEGVAMMKMGVVQSYNSWHLIGCWLYPFVCVVVWPLWLMQWTLTFQKIPNTSK